MIGLKARSTLVPAETWAKEFIPYGTPCHELIREAEAAGDPVLKRLALLECEIARLHARLGESGIAVDELADGNPDAAVADGAFAAAGVADGTGDNSGARRRPRKTTNS